MTKDWKAKYETAFKTLKMMMEAPEWWTLKQLKEIMRIAAKEPPEKHKEAIDKMTFINHMTPDEMKQVMTALLAGDNHQSI
jgi:hypothetical protein